MSLPKNLVDFALLVQPQPVHSFQGVDISTGLAEWLKPEDQANDILRDIELRVRMGAQKYGARLRSHNGRSALVDLYQELLDAINYSFQLKLEGKDDGMLCRKLVKLAKSIRVRILVEQKEGQ